MINKSIINVEDEFSFTNEDVIERIIINDDRKDIERLYLDDNYSNEYKAILIENIFSNLAIDVQNPHLKQSVESVLKAMNNNFFNGLVTQRLFILSELLVPLYLKEKHKNIEWVWFNQLFTYAGNPRIPARGLDCGFINNDQFIFCEVKSSEKENNYKNQIDDSIKSFLNIDTDKITFIKSMLSFLRDISNINFDSKIFLIGTLCWGFDKNIKNLNIPEKLNHSSISFFEIRAR